MQNWPRIAPTFFLVVFLLGLVMLAPAEEETKAQTANAKTRETATFAGGCFWCMEPPFDKLDGVISTTSGYTGGQTKNPSYTEVSSGGTGHAESVQVIFDPTQVSYTQLLIGVREFFLNISAS